MHNELPIIITITYAVFTTFQFYQALHVKTFRGGSQGALLAINVSAFLGMAFSYGYLVYYAVAVKWYLAIALWCIAFIARMIWFFVEAKLNLRKYIPFASLAAFAVLPIAAYILLSQMP